MAEPSSRDLIQEEVFSSDEEFDEDEDADTESDSDVDAKLAEDDVFDIEFFKCYSALKKKDGKIYDKDVKFFTEVSSEGEEGKNESNDDEKTNRKMSKTPKMTLLDHQLNLNEDEIEDSGRPKIDLNEPVSKSYYEKELEEIKKSIEKISENVDSESDDDLLVVKGTQTPAGPSKPRKTINKLLDKLEDDEDEEISHLKQIWSDPAKLSEEDKFLRDYILNKRYMPTNQEDNDDASSKPAFFSKNLDDMSDVDEDDEEKSKVKKHKVDHHSDEKDFDKISRIPRNSTKTIRDLVEKREKKEKRLKSLEKVKKKKRALVDADCEDIVGDLHTKFQYRETEANDYGLSAEELLMATDEELEKWVSLKDAIKYKTRDEELAHKRKYEQRRHDIELKKQIFKSIYGEDRAGDDKSSTRMLPSNGVESKKNKKRKRVDSGSSQVDEPTPSEEPNDSRKNKKKRKRGLGHKKFVKKTGVAPDRLLAYGLSKTKLKKNKLL